MVIFHSYVSLPEGNTKKTGGPPQQECYSSQGSEGSSDTLGRPWGVTACRNEPNLPFPGVTLMHGCFKGWPIEEFPRVQ